MAPANEVALIKPANIEESMLNEISAMRRQNLIACQVAEIKHLGRVCTSSFLSLTGEYFGLNTVQVKEFSDQKIAALHSLVYKKAEKTFFWHRVFYWAVPIIGWGSAIRSINEGMDTDNLIRSTRKLKQMIGDNFSDEIIKALKKY